MHPRMEELLQYLDRQREILRIAVERVPPELREVVPEPGRWSVAGVIEHLARVETSLVRLFTARLTEAKALGLGAETDSTPILGSLGMERVIDRSQRIATSQAGQPQAGQPQPGQRQTGQLQARQARWRGRDRACSPRTA